MRFVIFLSNTIIVTTLNMLQNQTLKIDTQEIPNSNNTPITKSKRKAKTKPLNIKSKFKKVKIIDTFVTEETESIIDPDTSLLLYNGTVINASELVVGDILMGDDSTPRNVLSVNNDSSEMYNISPIKGESIIVGEDHMISLKLSKNPIVIPITKGFASFKVRWSDEKGNVKSKNFNHKLYGSEQIAKEKAYKFRDDYEIYKDVVLDITVKDYMKKTKTWKTYWKVYRVAVIFQENKPLNLDPYLVGLWLGDGTSSESSITTIDPEIVDYLNKEVKQMDMSLVRRTIKGENTITYYMRGNGWRNNMFLKELQITDMINNKHIPHKYKIASLKDRLKLIAGLIDTDGSIKNNCYDFVQKSTILFDDLIFVARSCGFSAYPTKCEKGCWYKDEYRNGEYNRMAICGDIMNIPVILRRKKANIREQIKSVLNTGPLIEHIGNLPCIKISVDGNKRFVLGDFTVTG